jgi:hypothetical protein
LELGGKKSEKVFHLFDGFLSVSFIGSLIQGIFFRADNAFKIKPPILYSKSKMEQNTNKTMKKKWKNSE